MTAAGEGTKKPGQSGCWGAEQRAESTVGGAAGENASTKNDGATGDTPAKKPVFGVVTKKQLTGVLVLVGVWVVLAGVTSGGGAGAVVVILAMGAGVVLMVRQNNKNLTHPVPRPRAYRWERVADNVAAVTLAALWFGIILGVRSGVLDAKYREVAPILCAFMFAAYLILRKIASLLYRTKESRGKRDRMQSVVDHGENHFLLMEEREIEA